MSGQYSARFTRTVGLTLSIIVSLSGVLLAGLGYRAILAWRQDSTRLAQRQTTETVDHLVLALARDMQGAQRTLGSADLEESARGLPYSAIHLVASAFARFPYPESFFAWRDVDESTLPVLFNRRDRQPAWMPTEQSSGRVPVVGVSNSPVGRALLDRIRVDAAEGRHFAMFEITLGGAPYQVVARLIHDDVLHQHLAAVLGFTVNLEWARQYYFRELIDQAMKTEGGSTSGVNVLVTDETGKAVVGTRMARVEPPTGERTFSLLFFDPLLVAAHAPADLPRRLWTVTAVPSEDSPLAAAMGGAIRLTILGTIATAMLILGTVLTAQAARTTFELAELRSDFVSCVSHELKAPLATIQAAGEMLAAGKVKEETNRRDYAGLMVQEAKRLTRLVENLLAFSRVTDAATADCLEPLALDLVAHAALRRINPQLVRAGFTVSVEVPLDVPAILADRDAILLLLDNLLDNVIRHAGDDRRLEISANVARSVVTLVVRDHGRGIPPDEIRHVTRKFYRASNAGAGGTGLGLAIARRVAALHQGTLRIESVMGSGTAVLVSFPALSPDGQPADLHFVAIKPTDVDRGKFGL